MKELLGTARNLSILVSDGEPSAVIEVILITSEPTFAIDAGGEMVKSRVASTIRFSSTPDDLRRLSERLRTFAENADAMIVGVEVSAVPACPPEMGD